MGKILLNAELERVGQGTLVKCVVECTNVTQAEIIKVFAEAIENLEKEHTGIISGLSLELLRIRLEEMLEENKDEE